MRGEKGEDIFCHAFSLSLWLARWKGVKKWVVYLCSWRLCALVCEAVHTGGEAVPPLRCTCLEHTQTCSATVSTLRPHLPSLTPPTGSNPECSLLLHRWKIRPFGWTDNNSSVSVCEDGIGVYLRSVNAISVFCFCFFSLLSSNRKFIRTYPVAF